MNSISQYKTSTRVMLTALQVQRADLGVHGVLLEVHWTGGCEGNPAKHRHWFNVDYLLKNVPQEETSSASASCLQVWIWHRTSCFFFVGSAEIIGSSMLRQINVTLLCKILTSMKSATVFRNESPKNF